MNIPPDADHIGFYRGFDLFYAFKPQALFSARAMAYLYTRSKEQNVLDFVQVASVRWELTDGLTAEEVERRLAVDVISRAKIRIQDRSYQNCEVYTVELDSISMARARAA